MMINNGVGALLLVPLALSPTRFGELGHVHEIAAFDARQWALLLLSCINGVAISYAAIHLQKFVSASTLMVLANSNKFAVVAFGIFVLGESRSWQAVLGCVVALSGGVVVRQRPQRARGCRRGGRRLGREEISGAARPGGRRRGAATPRGERVRDARGAGGRAPQECGPTPAPKRVAECDDPEARAPSHPPTRLAARCCRRTLLPGRASLLALRM